MTDNYMKLVENNLAKLYQDLPDTLETNMGAAREGDRFSFKAFGQMCEISPEQILLGGEAVAPILGILVSLYALNAVPDACILEPFKAFKEIPDSMPYTGAFVTHTEQVLVPHVEKIKAAMPAIVDTLDGEISPKGAGGDFSMLVRPLPKVALCYIFYEPDEDFPASATCLYSNNAGVFIPVDGLADVGEYTSKKIISLL